MGTPWQKNILRTIYEVYEEWQGNTASACQKGCAACCSQNVTMTAVEGEVLLEYIREKGLQEWFVNLLQKWQGRKELQPLITHNGFARNCLQGVESEIGSSQSQDCQQVCLFLGKGDICLVYQARPFGCRCFSSQTDCRASGAAKQSDELLAINTATMQVIEHLGQKEFWGNIYDVLLVLCSLGANADIGQFFSDKMKLNGVHTRLLSAEPIPGFLIMPEEREVVSNYLETLFKKEVMGRTIEHILNNK